MRFPLTILILLFAAGCWGRTIVVGKNQVVSSIRKGIEMAADGDTILLQKGIYKEGALVITRSIHLIGVDEPVIDGENKYEMLTVSGSRILIKGIHFAHSAYSSMNDYAALKIIDASYVVIENNLITDAFFAIHVAKSSNTIISNNRIEGIPKSEQTSGNGIHLWKCQKMVVEDNHIQGHRDGIYFEFVTHSIISNNISTKNIRYGLHFMFSHNDTYMENTFRENGAGVAVMYSHEVLMMKNHFDHNWGSSAYGILLKEISDSHILNNSFEKNTVAILMEGSNRIIVGLNRFLANGWSIRMQASCSESEIHHNNFEGNTFDIATNGSLTLNRFYNNYWDRYDGYDIDRNGMGDIPYHPISLYSMVIEQNPNSVLLLRSFMVSLLDKAEKAIPSLTPENLSDESPLMKPLSL
jgi:nitrous oxidase accessory protein